MKFFIDTANVEEINFYGKVCHYSAEAFSKLIKIEENLL